jgi:hypothetical protein
VCVWTNCDSFSFGDEKLGFSVKGTISKLIKPLSHSRSIMREKEGVRERERERESES